MKIDEIGIKKNIEYFRDGEWGLLNIDNLYRVLELDKDGQEELKKELKK